MRILRVWCNIQKFTRPSRNRMFVGVFKLWPGRKAEFSFKYSVEYMSIVKREGTVDILCGGCDELEAAIVREFLRLNRLKLREIISILARMVVNRSWLTDIKGRGYEWSSFDSLIKQMLKESDYPAWAKLSFSQRYLGHSILPVSRKFVKDKKAEIMAAKEEGE